MDPIKNQSPAVGGFIPWGPREDSQAFHAWLPSLSLRDISYWRACEEVLELSKMKSPSLGNREKDSRYYQKNEN
jgi:hypothetical protein